jgi:hypothetical protein
MKILKWIVIIGVIVFIVLQVIPYNRNHTNPPVVSEPKWDSPATREFAVRACFDCHSNETVWPWYSNIAPVSWLVQQDVDQGRRRLNFSDWANTREKGEIVEVISGGYMPPSKYLLMHPNAKLTQAEKDAFLIGIKATIANQ